MNAELEEPQEVKALFHLIIIVKTSLIWVLWGIYIIPKYRCYIPSIGYHFISSKENCDGEGTKENLMGYGFAM